jgi:hypothetical protein
MRRIYLSLIFGWFILHFMGTLAQAQDKAVDVQLFRPSIFGGHFHSIEGAHKHRDLWYGLGLYLNYADTPFIIEGGWEEDFDSAGLNAVATANVTAAFKPWTWFAIGADMPVHFYTSGNYFSDPQTGRLQSDDLISEPTSGDLKTEMKFSFLDIEKYYVGAAFAPFATFPTGDPGFFLGEGTINFGGKLLLEVNAYIFHIAINGGYLYREERDIVGEPVGSQFIYGFGIGDDYKYGLGWSLEFYGSQSAQKEEFLGKPLEAMLFFRWTFPSKVRLMTGFGSGMTSGVGSPSYRLTTGVDYHPDSGNNVTIDKSDLNEKSPFQKTSMPPKLVVDPDYIDESSNKTLKALHAKDSHRLAVLDFLNPAGLDQQEVDYISDLVRTEARKMLPQDQYVLLTKENIYDMLPPDKRNLAQCEGQCEVETGRMIGVQYLVTGEIVRFGGELRVTVRLYDVTTGNLLESRKAAGKNVLDLEAPLERVASVLFAILPNARR